MTCGCGKPRSSWTRQQSPARKVGGPESRRLVPPYGAPPVPWVAKSEEGKQACEVFPITADEKYSMNSKAPWQQDDASPSAFPAQLPGDAMEITNCSL